MAIHPVRHTVAVAWFANGSTFDDSKDGQVWAKVEQADHTWSPLQTVNVGYVGKAGYGGLAMTIGYDGVVSIVYGVGGGDDRRVQFVESRDDGVTWSMPETLDSIDADAAPAEATPTSPASPDPVATPTAESADDAQSGAVIALSADPSGGLHLLYRQRGAGGARIGYAYRAPSEALWRLSTPGGDRAQTRGALGLLPQPDGRVKRFVAVQNGGAIMLYSSLDGVSWDAAALPVGQYLAPETIFTMTMVVAPRGPGLVAVTWGQYARGGVFAAVSLDGGVTWSQEERIAQHNLDGAAFDTQDDMSRRSGFDPWVVYDAETDQLAASWVEMNEAAQPRSYTTVYAVRALAEVTVPLWRYGVSPETAENERPPTLGPAGYQTRLYGSPDGQAHALLGVDAVNDQHRVYVQPLLLPGLLKNAES